MDRNEKLGIAAFAVSVAAAAVGIFTLTRRRGALAYASEDNSKAHRRALIATTKASGMVTKTYKSKMPIKERIAHIQDMVYVSSQNPEVRQLALAITGKGTRRVKVGSQTYDVVGANCPARDGECEARAIYNWAKANIRYSGDLAPIKHGAKGSVEPVDIFQSAQRTAEFGGGDCDDHTVIVSALLAHNGITPKMAVTAPTRFGPEGHIYAVAMLPKERPSKELALDTTLPCNDCFGKEAAWGRKKLYDA